MQKFKKKCLTTHQTFAILAPNQTTPATPQNLEKSLHELKILTNKVNFAKVDSTESKVLKATHEVMKSYSPKLTIVGRGCVLTWSDDDGWKESRADYESRCRL
mgnify:CR=1 FL=1